MENSLLLPGLSHVSIYTVWVQNRYCHYVCTRHSVIQRPKNSDKTRLKWSLLGQSTGISNRWGSWYRVLEKGRAWSQHWLSARLSSATHLIHLFLPWFASPVARLLSHKHGAFVNFNQKSRSLTCFRNQTWTLPTWFKRISWGLRYNFDFDQ